MQNPDKHDEALRSGLRALDTPELSNDFDNRVIAALGRPRNWWEAFLISARPALSAMCCSLVVTLAVTYLTLHGPISFPSPRMPEIPAQRINMAIVDRVLDLPNLRADSLQQLTRLSSASAPLPDAPVHRAPDMRHACRLTKTLVA